MLFPKNILSQISGFMTLLMILSCNSNEFPDVIKTELTDNHFRIRGTKLFVKEIEGFKYIPDAYLINSDSVYICYLSTPANFLASFNADSVNYMNSKDSELISTKKFTINNFNGMFAKFKQGNAYWLYFVFGDSTVENRIMATFPVTHSFDDKIFEIVKNTYFQASFNLNPLEAARFEIDTASVDYHFVDFLLGQYNFIEDEYYKFKQANIFTIVQLPRIQDSAMLDNICETMIETLKNSNGILSVQEIDKKKILINSNKTLRIILHLKEGSIVDNKDCVLYMVISGNEDGGVIFSGMIYHDEQKCIDLMDKIVKSVKIKKPDTIRAKLSGELQAQAHMN